MKYIYFLKQHMRDNKTIHVFMLQIYIISQLQDLYISPYDNNM